MKSTNNTLRDKNILVTRPSGLHINLCERLTQLGASAIHYAAINITAPTDASSRDYVREHIKEFDIAIFISPTSVTTTLEFMPTEVFDCTLAAIGSRTQQALEQAGLTVSIQPQGHDSDNLLQHPKLQAEHIKHKKIVILRGENGRDKLGDELYKRGAQINYAAMYSRVKPAHTRAFDDALIQTLHAITISSNEGLQNLYDMAIDAKADVSYLLSVPLFVPGERAHNLALSLQFEKIVVADNATDSAMLTALCTRLRLS